MRSNQFWSAESSGSAFHDQETSVCLKIELSDIRLRKELLYQEFSEIGTDIVIKRMGIYLQNKIFTCV